MQSMTVCQGSLASKVAILHDARFVSSQASNLSVSLYAQAGCGRFQRGRVTCLYADEFPVVDEKVKSLQPSELNLPVQSLDMLSAKEISVDKDGNEALASTVQTFEDVSPAEAKEALKAAKEKFGRTTVSKALQASKKRFGKDGVGKLALYGGIATLGLVLSGAVLTSLEVLPLVPEAMQTVGVAYSVLVASRMLQGKPVSLTPESPLKAVIELVDSGKPNKVQRTSLVLPQDLDEGVVAAMEKLAKERDAAVNQMEEMRRTTAEYARVVAEKEALEAVALQLAEERDVAMTEVTALKSAVEMMTDRMKSIEQMLEREVGQLKYQNEALETVALQLAKERDSAMEEIVNLQQVVASKARSDNEKQALEEVAVQLAQERDTALSELEKLKRVLGSMRAAGATAAGLTPEQDLLIEARVRDIRSQLLDGQSQKEEVDKLIAHLVEEFVVRRPIGP